MAMTVSYQAAVQSPCQAEISSYKRTSRDSAGFFDWPDIGRTYGKQKPFRSHNASLIGARITGTPRAREGVRLRLFGVPAIGHGADD